VREFTVVGSGPNGLAAAIVLARAGRSVTVLERADTLGGGCRSEELTLPGFVHDTCSTVQALALASPFLRKLDLLDAVHPPAPLAHPLDDGTAVVLERSVNDTAAGLGADGPAYRALMEPLVRNAHALYAETLGPLRPPRHPLVMARFGPLALRSADGLLRARFASDRARALLAGCAAHSIMPLTELTTAAFGLILAASAHAVGWPLARGGSQTFADALVAHARSLGVAFETGHHVDALPDGPALLDITPRGLLALAGDRLPSGRYRRGLERYRYGPGVFKVDWALDGPAPWTAPEAARAGTVHLGGTLEEITATEALVGAGRHPDRPFVLYVQATGCDPSRAPEGKHTAWAYCHVPNGSTKDMTEAIERQVERFAPGFRERILARHTMDSAEVERRNPNYAGGDINGGRQDIRQLFTRPVAQLNPYRTPLKGVYLCSSATPPGGGVHGMGGYWAARTALRDT
jgi:phytoene dehydrogenase-like protein